MFDAARRADSDNVLTDEDVAKITAALNAAGVPQGRIEPDAPSEPERNFTPAQTSKQGITLIHSFEGFARKLPDGSVQAYPDPGTGGKPWTIGWGSTTDEDGKPIEPGTIWSKERADRRFEQHLGQFERQVITALGSSIHNTSQEQFDALVSFTYNVGAGALTSSTLLRMHKAGNHAGAADQFGRWNKAGRRVMAGLTRRRAAEAELYRKGS